MQHIKGKSTNILLLFLSIIILLSIAGPQMKNINNILELIFVLCYFIGFLGVLLTSVFSAIENLRKLTIPLVIFSLTDAILLGAFNYLPKSFKTREVEYLDLFLQYLGHVSVMVCLVVVLIFSLKYSIRNRSKIISFIYTKVRSSATSIPSNMRLLTIWIGEDFADLTYAFRLISRVTIFRLFAISDLFLITMILFLLLTPISTTLAAFISGILLLGLFGMFIWQILSNLLKLWVDIWKKLTPPDPTPIKLSKDDSDIRLLDSISDRMESRDFSVNQNRNIAHSIFQSLLLSILILGLLSTAASIQIWNKNNWQLEAIEILSEAVDAILSNFIFWYDPLVSWMYIYESTVISPEFGAILISVLALPGVIVAKNLVYKIEEVLYKYHSQFGTHGRIAIWYFNVLFLILVVGSIYLAILNSV